MNDVLQFTTDGSGNKVPNNNLIRSTCPNNCSSNGLCDDSGSCVCNAGFAHVDCSVNLSEAPKIIGSSLQTNSFDISSKGNFSDIVISLARFVAENSDSSIRVSSNVN